MYGAALKSDEVTLQLVLYCSFLPASIFFNKVQFMWIKNWFDSLLYSFVSLVRYTCICVEKVALMALSVRINRFYLVKCLMNSIDFNVGRDSVSWYDIRDDNDVVYICRYDDLSYTHKNTHVSWCSLSNFSLTAKIVKYHFIARIHFNIEFFKIKFESKLSIHLFHSLQ